VTVAKILIVEDNADNMKLFHAVLTLRGHAVTGLPGGDRLMDTVGGDHPDLILLDIQLPGADGYQLLAMLRSAMTGLPPVVALTAHAMSGDRERAMTAGFDGYLTKPIDVATFGETVEGFLRR
jgi:two-component system cell cycle response regulator DivK